MGLFSRKPAKEKPTDLHVGDPRFDSWETVAQFGDLPSAQAFAGHLHELGFACALTADWPPDRHGNGDIFLAVPADLYGDATVALDGLDI